MIVLTSHGVDSGHETLNNTKSVIDNLMDKAMLNSANVCFPSNEETNNILYKKNKHLR